MIEEMKIIDEYESFFVTKRELLLKHIKFSKKKPNCKFILNIVFVCLLLILNALLYLVLTKQYQFKIWDAIGVTLVSNFIFTPIVASCNHWIEKIVSKIWMRSTRYKKQNKLHNDGISYVNDAQNVKNKFEELINQTFSPDNLNLLNRDSFETLIQHFYRITNLYFEHASFVYANLPIESYYRQEINPNIFLNFLKISSNLSYELFDRFRTYREFYSLFFERLRYREQEIKRRRVFHTKRYEVDEAYEEFFIKRKVDETLSSFYQDFTEEEIKVLNLDLIKQELEALQNLKQTYTITYVPKIIAREPNVRSKIIHPKQTEIAPIQDEKLGGLQEVDNFKNKAKAQVLNDLNPFETKTLSIKEPQPIINGNINNIKTSEISKPILNKNKVKRKTKISKELLQQKLQQNNLVGELGEQFIFENELEKMSSRIKPGFSVIHSSKEVGDGLGYDIESFDDNYIKKYIEVKTTVATERDAFFLSKNEMNKFQSASNLHIYRVINFNLSEGNGDIIKIISKKQLEDEYNIVPSNYLVRLK